MMACDRGTSGAPKMPWPIRYSSNGAKVVAVAHSIEDRPKPMTATIKTRRSPKRATIQPVIGVATAVATTFSVITQET